MKERVTLTIEKKIIDAFRKYCRDRGMKVSPKVELFMDKEMKHRR